MDYSTFDPMGFTPPSSSFTSASYSTYMLYLNQLAPVQRALLLLNLQKAHYFYSVQAQVRTSLVNGYSLPTGVSIPSPSERNETMPSLDENEELLEIKELFVACNLWNVVEGHEQQAQIELQNWTIDHRNAEIEDQLIQIQHVAYLLHVPPGIVKGLGKIPTISLLKSLYRAQAIKTILVTMLQILITLQPSASAMAHGRPYLPLDIPISPLPFDHTPPPQPQPQQPIIQPPTLLPGQRALVVTLTFPSFRTFMTLMTPIIFLSVKLAFVLFIFARHASPMKRGILITMAVLFLFYKTWELLSRGIVFTDRGRLRERRPIPPIHVQPPQNPPVQQDPYPQLHPHFQQPRQEPQPQQRAPSPHPQHTQPEHTQSQNQNHNHNQNQNQPQHNLGQRANLVPGIGNQNAQNGVVPDNAGGERPQEQSSSRSSRRVPQSRWSPKYWINWIAAIGLASEAHELGLVPRSIAGRPIAPPAPLPLPEDAAGQVLLRRRRAIRTFIVAFVLFWGTMIPAVEKKRKRALEKRERLLLARKEAKLRRAMEKSAKHAAIPVASSSVISNEVLFADGVGEPDQVPTNEYGVPVTSPSDETSNQVEDPPVEPPNPPATLDEEREIVPVEVDVIPESEGSERSSDAGQAPQGDIEAEQMEFF